MLSTRLEKVAIRVSEVVDFEMWATHSTANLGERRPRILLGLALVFLVVNLVIFRTFGVNLFADLVGGDVPLVSEDDLARRPLTSPQESKVHRPVVEVIAAKTPAQPDTAEHLAFCIFVRNQALDLPEWLTHHYYHHGVRRFYIQDDGSTPPLSTFQYPIPAESLTFTFHGDHDNAGDRQNTLYEKCITDFGSKHSWMAMFDADEFLEVIGDATLIEVLKELEQDASVGALGVNWKMHTSAGQLTRVESVRQAYDQCIVDYLDGQERDNRHVKSIVRPMAFAAPASPHHFALKAGYYAVGEDGKRYGADDSPSSPYRVPITRNRLALHHYVSKSREEFQSKIDRWSSIAAKTAAKSWAWWEYIEELIPHVECSEMTMYKP